MVVGGIKAAQGFPHALSKQRLQQEGISLGRAAVCVRGVNERQVERNTLLDYGLEPQLLSKHK